MAGKVKKGFGTYMFIFLLMLIAAGLIVLLVMMFSPFKKVMGYQYIYYNNVGEESFTEHHVTGGDASDMFDFSS